MNHQSYSFSCNQQQSDLLIALLSHNNFSGFLEEENSLTAFISADEKISDSLIQQLELLGINFPQPKLIAEKNWNEEWEKNFEPIEVEDEVLVRAAFHRVEKKFPFEIIIDPKMSFGTGHHATTYMMIQFMLEHKNDFHGSDVFDFGAGTGILSVMAEKLGAKNVLSIDHEEWAFENMKENFLKNNSVHCNALLADCPPDVSEKFDIILANINRNVIVEFFPSLQKLLKSSGKLFCSGFLPVDEVVITLQAEKINLKPVAHKTKDNWSAIVFQKS
ncbi:MAG: 50S ribosomal protein L11 methyltransferase [Sphingobacteriales bacterium]|nr:MAG: 50S ribosomal protein L11 methyltransferase [Sphingobacteriales bacterium]